MVDSFGVLSTIAPPTITGDHSKQGQMLSAKIAKYIVFGVFHRSYLLWPPVIAAQAPSSTVQYSIVRVEGQALKLGLLVSTAVARTPCFNHSIMYPPITQRPQWLQTIVTRTPCSNHCVPLNHAVATMVAVVVSFSRQSCPVCRPKRATGGGHTTTTTMALEIYP